MTKLTNSGQKNFSLFSAEVFINQLNNFSILTITNKNFSILQARLLECWSLYDCFCYFRPVCWSYAKKWVHLQIFLQSGYKLKCDPKSEYRCKCPWYNLLWAKPVHFLPKDLTPLRDPYTLYVDSQSFQLSI